MFLVGLRRAHFAVIGRFPVTGLSGHNEIATLIDRSEIQSETVYHRAVEFGRHLDRRAGLVR
jgi:hypothetical protein